MRLSGARARSLAPNRPAIMLMVLLAALVLFGGCARSRNAATQSWSGVVTDGTSAFVGTRDGRVVQIELIVVEDRVIAQTGATFGPPETEGNSSPAFYGTPTLSDGRLYAGGYHGVVYAMRGTPGDAGGRVLDGLGEFDIEGNPLAQSIAGSVVPVDDVVVFAGSEDAEKGRLWVLDADLLGQNFSALQVERCRYPREDQDPIGQLWTTPTVSDGIAYFGDLDHRLHAVSVETCETVWAPVELGGAIVAPPLILGGNLYVGAFDRGFYEVDLASGAFSELFTAGGWFWAGAATDGVRVYAPSLDGVLYAYNVRDKQLVWTYDQEGEPEPILSAPVVVDDKIVMASDSGIVTLLTSGGARLDSVKAGDDIRAPLSARDGIVYIHSLDEKVTALRVRGTRFTPEWSADVSG